MTAEVFDVRLKSRALSALALQTLEAIMSGTGGDASKLGAAREILDRAYGKCRTADETSAEPYTVIIRQFGDDADDEV